jgi:LL-diaminopimelate aminotransferase
LLQEIGVDAPRPKASLYVWAHVPEGYTSKSFADHLLDKTGVAVTPGTSYGAQGDGFFRMSLTVSDAEVDAAVARLRKLFAVEPAGAGIAG